MLSYTNDDILSSGESKDNDFEELGAVTSGIKLQNIVPPLKQGGGRATICGCSLPCLT